MTLLLCAIFFLSGVSALTFETLWFHQAGLALGNSVWASSLVLAGFMGGLGLGNALAVRHGDRVLRPVRLYAWLEALIGVSGVALVIGLPALSPLLARAFGPFLETGWALGALRLASAFVLLLAPSTAMGLTLPLLTRALGAASAAFGGVLGLLYGWNTLGAVVGAVATETLWIGALGIRGTALAAGALNLLAAAAAAALARRLPPLAPRPPPAEGRRHPGALPWLAAAFAFGFALLALEVVWFRFLSLFVFTHAVAFALMLGVVLAGIALGGLVAGRALAADLGRHRWAGPAALLSAALVVAGYAVFAAVLAPFRDAQIRDAGTIVWLSSALMLPVSFLSGALFTAVGAGLHAHLAGEARTTGALTLANTAGAALGALAGGFLLLPALGIERSLFALATLYAAAGGLLLARARPPARGLAATAAVAGVASLAFFPFGAMQERFLPPVRERLSCPQVVPTAEEPTHRITLGCDMGAVTVREGLVETIQYVEHERFSRPYYHRLITDSYSMSGTLDLARRYMKLFVYLPAALHPKLERALLISFGVGSTARALTTTPGVERIDVVDISPEILELASVVYPGAENPLLDPRVHVHVEDGRYFLQTTDLRFDLITGEPPPPGAAGVVNLYTREYFELVHERLAEGGIASYWLPMHSLSGPSARAILGAFCAAFEDCSLWNASGMDLVMLGTRGTPRATLAGFTRQWRSAAARPELEALGFERPEQLGALFVGDADYLETLTEDAPVLVDDRPKRVVAPDTEEDGRETLLHQWRAMSAARQRFEQSTWIAEHWPEELRKKTLPWFRFQRILDTFGYGIRHPRATPLKDAHTLLTETPLRAPVVWLLGSDADLQRLVAPGPDRLEGPRAAFHRGIGRLAERKYGLAAHNFSRAEEDEEVALAARLLRIYALAMAGRRDLAGRLAAGLAPELAPLSATPAWTWLHETFDLDAAAQATAGDAFHLSDAQRTAAAALPCRALAGHVSPSCWLPVEVEPLR